MGHEYIKANDVFNASTNGTVPKPSATDITSNRVLCANGTWVDQSGGGGADKDFALFEEWSSFTDPINHTFTAPEAGQYLVVAVAGDNQNNYGNQVTSTGTLVFEETATPDDRHPFINIYQLAANDTITVKLSNYSGGAYRGTMAVIAKVIGTAIQSMTKVYEDFVRDAVKSVTETLSSGDNYLLIGTSCGGTSISSSISFSGYALTSGISKNYSKVYGVKSMGTDVTQSQSSDLAGGSYIVGYLII